MSKSDFTHITMVLDRSGSMESIATDTIGGVNTFLSDQKKLPGRATFSLILFDHEYLIPHLGKPIGEVPPLDATSYVPRGQTALLDAIGRAIVETGEKLSAMPEDERPAKVLCVIVTDGHENASREYNKARIAEMIKHQQEAYSWQFVFLGANQDAIAVGGSMGVHTSGAMTFVPTSEAIGSAFRGFSRNVGSYRSGHDEKYLWKDGDREDQEKHKAKN